MAFTLGWAVNDWKDSIYWRDPSVDVDGTPPESLTAYFKDGDASHLRVLNGATPAPTRIRFRALTANERAAIMAMTMDRVVRIAGESDADYAARVQADGAAWPQVLLLAFRIGVDFPDGPADICKRVRVRGVDMLDERLVNALVRTFGDDIYVFYGGLVWAASNLSDDEKKTSSPA